MVRKRIVAMITTLVFVLATLCAPVSFAGSAVFADVSTNPNATSVNATDPNATDPNATDPNATDPNATDPNATDPNGIVAEVSYYVSGEKVIDKVCYYEDRYAAVFLPYTYDRDKGVSITVLHLDGTESSPTINWESDEWGQAVFYSVIDDKKIKHELEVYVEGPSSENDCEIIMKAYDSEDGTWEAYIDCSLASDEDGIVTTIPYGYNKRVELYVNPYSDYARVEGLYLQDEKELGYVLVSDGETRTFKVIAQNNEEKEYKITFKASDGTSADVEMAARFSDKAVDYKDYLEPGRQVDIIFDEEKDGIKTADVILPYMYDDENGIYLWIKNTDSYITDIEDSNIYMGDAKEKTVVFDVTSPNGSVTKTYQINFIIESEEASKKADLEVFTVTYKDENQKEITLNIDPTDAADGDGATITIPESIMKAYNDREYYVDVYAKPKGYSFINSADTNADGYNSDRSRDYIKYSIDIGWQSSATLTFDVNASNDKDKKTYEIKLVNGARAGQAYVDEVQIDYTRINETDISSSYVWLDQDTNSGEVVLNPFDESKPVVLKGKTADGTQINKLIEFEEGKNEAVVTFTSKSLNGENEITYTVKVSKPVHPAVNVSYIADGTEYQYECNFDENLSDTVFLPYTYSYVDFDITLLDGTKLEPDPEIVWDSEVREDEHDTLKGIAKFEANGKEYTINIQADGISSDTGAFLELQAWDGKTYINNEEAAYKYIYVDTEEAATNEGSTVIIPYGCENNSSFYVDANSEYSNIKGSNAAGDPYSTRVIPGETRVYTVTAQDGTTKDYKIKFVASEGNSTEIDMDMCVEWSLLDEEEADRFFYKYLEFEDKNGVMTADAVVPYLYDEKAGIVLYEYSNEYVAIDSDILQRIYPDVDKVSTYEFTVTSPNGEVKQAYAINFMRESVEEAAKAEIAFAEVQYTDENGEAVYSEVDVSEDNNGNIIAYIPETADFSEYITLRVYTNGYAFVTKHPQIEMGFGDYDMFGVSFLVSKEKSQEVSFELTSSDGSNSKAYNIIVKAGEKPHECIWDEGEITTDPTCTEPGIITYTCECGETKTDEVDALGHDYETAVTAPTCTEKGYTTYTCKNDAKHTYVDDYVNASGHDMTTHAAIAETCETAGNIEYYTCDVCGKYFLDKEGVKATTANDVVVAKKGHKMTTHKAVAATSKKTGNVKYYTCDVCDKYFLDKEGTKTTTAKGVIIPKHKCKWDKGTITTEPTYAKKGVKTYKCTIKGCAKTKEESVAKRVYKAKQTNVTAQLSTESKGYNNVCLSWSTVKGAEGYKVYYKKSSASKWTTKYVKGKTTFTTPDLSSGANYKFKVAPYITEGTKKFVSANYDGTSAYTLKKVSTPKVSKSSGSKVKVSWTNISGESGYEISQATSKSKINVVETYKTTKGKSKTIEAKKGKKLYYKVRAFKYVKVNGETVKVYGPWSTAKYYKR